jgi:hypothetical protein
MKTERMKTGRMRTRMSNSGPDQDIVANDL